MFDLDVESTDYLDRESRLPSDESWTLEVQGQFLKVRCHREKPVKRKIVPRKPITQFTRKSRFAILCLLHKIDWRNVPPSLFITLTYPDSLVHYDYARRSKERYLFIRYMEKHLLRHIPYVWRVEWKARKSGSLVGQIAPHIHLLTFGVQGFDKRKVREVWSRVIHHDGFVSVDCQDVPKGKAVAFYVSKYCAKVDPSQRLDIVPNLNRTGQHWGLGRRSEVPWHLLCKGEVLGFKKVRWIRKAVSGKIPWYDLSVDKGFTVIGELAELLADQIIKH